MYCSVVPTINCVFQLLKSSPVARSTHLLGSAYGHETWAYLTDAILATVAFLLLGDTNSHASMSRLYSLLTAT